MAVTKEIKIDDKIVKFRASAATPKFYRFKFRRDIFADLSKLEKNMASENLDNWCFEILEDIAYTMAKQAAPEEVPDEPAGWLDNFDLLSIYNALPDLLTLWGLNTETQVNAKKNSKTQSGD